jgi:N6-adenosine-specific RNA methylase IME4
MDKFEIIYVDCPWDYSYVGKNIDRNFTKNQNGFAAVVSAKDTYDCLKMEEIANLPVKEIAADNSLLFMWVTGPMVDISIEVMKMWGFQFKTVAFVWNKRKVMPGFYTMSQCEFCFVGKRGNIPKPRGARNILQYYEQTRLGHSQKPTGIRKRIDKMFPTQNKIELFARKKADGWLSVGNEIDGKDIRVALPELIEKIN